MLRVLSLTAVVGFAALVAGCGRSGSGGTGGTVLSVTDVRDTMVTLLVAATEGESAVSKVKDKLAAAEFMGLHSANAQKPFGQQTEAERASAYQSCFNQLLAVPNTTTLKDMASIQAALAAGRIDIRERTRGADVAFQGPPADGKGLPVKFKAGLTLGPDSKWRLISCEPQFGR